MNKPANQPRRSLIFPGLATVIEKVLGMSTAEVIDTDFGEIDRLIEKKAGHPLAFGLNGGRSVITPQEIEDEFNRFFFPSRCQRLTCWLRKTFV